jgi:four helix bundle protein
MENGKKVLRERTMEYARRIVRMFSALPQNTLAQTLGKQVLRSGTSVGANYREADSGRSKPEFIAKMGDCLKELSETEYWLELMAAEKVLPSDRLAA